MSTGSVLPGAGVDEGATPAQPGERPIEQLRTPVWDPQCLRNSGLSQGKAGGQRLQNLVLLRW